MKYFLSAVLLIMTFVTTCNAANDYQELIAKSEARVYQGSNGAKLPYRLFQPDNFDPNKSYPLIIFLHGAGGRGADNRQHMFNCQFLRLISGENRVKHPAFLIAPQCPAGKRWCETNWSERTAHKTPVVPSEGMACLLELVDELRKEFPLDKSRLYVLGTSMGGYGTCDFVCRRGNEVAAYVCVCGGADNEKICQFKNAKGWFFHGDKDASVPVERSRSAVAALKAAGCDVRYTERPGRGHNLWIDVYDTPGLDEWLFEQKLK